MLAGSVRSSVRSRNRRSAIKVATRAVLSATITGTLAVVFSSLSAADPPASLESLLDAARAEYGCPALQLDPVLNNVSHRIAGENADYVSHNPRSRTLPTSGEIPLLPTGSEGLLQVLREAGYNTNKTRLLIGYGDDSMGGPADKNAKAVMSAVVEGKALGAFSDCAYTKYGVGAVDNADISQGWPSMPPKAFTLISVVVAGASGTP